MIIRKEQEGDQAAIADITARAFRGVEYSDQTEPAIIERLRAAGTLTLSLVAIDHDLIVGHIAFSPVTIDGKSCGWFGLGPVSVDPDHQGQKIGSALIMCGIEKMRSEGASGCVLLGDPAYYNRFGFEADERLRYEGAPPEYFMRLNLTDSNTPMGRVEYHPAFIEKRPCENKY